MNTLSSLAVLLIVPCMALGATLTDEQKQSLIQLNQLTNKIRSCNLAFKYHSSYEASNSDDCKYSYLILSDQANFGDIFSPIMETKDLDKDDVQWFLLVGIDADLLGRFEKEAVRMLEFFKSHGQFNEYTTKLLEFFKPLAIKQYGGRD